MRSLASSLAFAFANALHPRMLWLMLWPVIAALGLWGVVALVFWAQFVMWLAGHVQGWVGPAAVIVHWSPADLALLVAKIVTLLALVPLVQLTALLILGVVGMPAIVEHVAARRYARLEKKRGGSLAGSVWNSVVALAGLCALGVVSIPFWLFPPLWPAIPVVVVGWVNQRVLRYDALAEHASAKEMRALLRSERGALYLLGALLALVAYVPLVGFFAPVLFGLAFAHYLLGQLEALRASPLERSVIEA